MNTQYETAVQLDDTYVMHTFARKPVEFVRGAGMKLWDTDGNEYLDFLSGIGVVSVGHCNPRVTEALSEQVGKLLHVSNYYYVEHRGEVAERISHMLAAPQEKAQPSVQPQETGTVTKLVSKVKELFGKGASTAPARSEEQVWQTFFANSGAEANEGAIKLARRWGKTQLGGAFGIVTADKSFHGRTLATLAATAQDAKQDPFAPLPAGFSSVPLNDIAALEAALDAEVDGTRPCAVLLEPIQGESGVWPCTREYLQAARTLTRERNMLLIFDEVQTGFFRTGTAFAFQQFGVEPDIVTMAKGIGGGVPMGGFAAKRDLASLMQPGMHGTTFGGGPLVCAAADVVTQIMCEPGFGAHVQETGAYLREKLSELPFVTDVRGLGLMCGVTLEVPLAGAVVQNGLENGLVLNAPAADILRFLPPLIATREDVDVLIEKLPTCYEKAVQQG